MTDKPKRALVIVFDGVEEIEALTPVDILRRASVQVTVASVLPQPMVTGRNEITFAADTDLSKIDPSGFDIIILPGGPGVFKLLENQSIRDILVGQSQAGKNIAAICAAPKVLAQHGLLEGITATSHASVREELPSASDETVVVDGLVTTSQGAGTAVAFSLSLVEQLCDKETAEQIAASIHS